MDSKLIQALFSLLVETGSLVCLGCSYENACGIHGCAIMRIAVDRLEQLTAEPPNDPLTLEELWGMDGEPVYAVPLGHISARKPHWVIVDLSTPQFLLHYGKTWLAYRRKPDGGGEWWIATALTADAAATIPVISTIVTALGYALEGWTAL